jgi:murein L,D-transpeptidase YcbB/YkuD
MKKGSLWLKSVIMAAGLCASTCGVALAVEPAGPERLIDKEFVAIIALRNGLDGNAARKLNLSKPQIKTLSDYYKSPDARLIWIGGEGLNKAAIAGLKTVIARADTFGLNPKDYSLADGEALAAQGSGPALAEAELRISLTAIDYASHAQAGRVAPRSIDPEFLDLNPQRPEAKQVLAALAGGGSGKVAETLEGYNPQHPQFKALKAKLAEARTAQKGGALQVRIPDGPSLGPDTYHSQIAIVRERLSVAPPLDAPKGNPSEYYDPALAEAVRSFQASRGLKPDGVIGRGTRDALNEGSVAVGVNTILSNMERWRWVPRTLGSDRFIIVNIPEFKFRVYDQGKPIYEERIVSGSPKHKTPIFSDEMETVVFNPYWNVPKSIIANEIVPALARDPNYLQRNNMEIVSQQPRPRRRYTNNSFFFWSEPEPSYDPYYLDPETTAMRQLPGPGNALGVVKFLFPNKHSVYMHDTPSKALFDKPSRAFSHGCMRVRNPLEFAKLVLRDQGYNDGKIQETLSVAHDMHVPLKRKIPVHVSYFTAWVDDDGKLNGYQDVYGHDGNVRVALKLESSKAVATTDSEFEVGEHGMQN